MSGKRDILGRKTGVWMDYFANGSPRLKITYRAGKYHGSLTQWHYNGNIRLICHYDSGKLSGTKLTWHKNGRLRSIGDFVEDEYSGLHITWYSNSNIKGIVSYEDGIRHGIEKEFNQAGELTNIKFNVRGKEKSLFEAFLDDDDIHE